MSETVGQGERPSNAEFSSAAGPTATPRWRKKRYWIPGLLVALAIIGIATNKNHPKTASQTTVSEVTTTASPTTTVPAAPAIPKSVKDSRKYIRDQRRNIDAVQANVQVVQIEVGLVSKGTATQADVNKLALTAQQAHDRLDESVTTWPVHTEATRSGMLRLRCSQRRTI